MFFITINHPKILNDLSDGNGVYLNSLVSQFHSERNATLAISKIQVLSDQNHDPVDFAKSTIKAFSCCLDSF